MKALHVFRSAYDHYRHDILLAIDSTRTTNTMKITDKIIMYCYHFEKVVVRDNQTFNKTTKNDVLNKTKINKQTMCTWNTAFRKVRPNTSVVSK